MASPRALCLASCCAMGAASARPVHTPPNWRGVLYPYVACAELTKQTSRAAYCSTAYRTSRPVPPSNLPLAGAHKGRFLDGEVACTRYCRFDLPPAGGGRGDDSTCTVGVISRRDRR